jgi:hypothetical protein
MQIHKDLLESNDICNCEGKKLLIESQVFFCSFKKRKTLNLVKYLSVFDEIVQIRYINFRVIYFAGFRTYSS